MLIAVEGLDHTGKSVMIRKIHHHWQVKLLEKDLPINLVDTIAYPSLITKSKIQALPNPFGYDAAKIFIEEFVKDYPKLSKPDKVVLADRYYFSTIAYQFHVPIDWFYHYLHKLIIEKKIVVPDYVFILMHRYSAVATDVFEVEDVQTKAAERYNRVLKENGLAKQVILEKHSRDETINQINTIIDKFLSKRI